MSNASDNKRFIVNHYVSLQVDQKTGEPNAPLPENVGKSEIALNLHQGAETLFVKNDNGEIVATPLGPRTSAETERVKAEALRIKAEQSRTLAEGNRTNAEDARTKAEQSRVEAEQARVEAEQERAIEFAGFAQDINKASKQCFIDRWNTLWNVNGTIYGKYDPDNAPDPQHPFMANKLWLTYDEAIIVDSVSSSMSRVCVKDMKYRYKNGKGYRTLAPIIGANGLAPDLSRCFESNKDIEVLVFQNYETANIQWAFWGCSKLRVIEELAYAQGQDPFGRCYNLETVKLYYIRGNVSFADCPKLNLESLNYMINWARNTEPITFTLHPDAYARVTDDIFAAAAAKNITIATP